MPPSVVFVIACIFVITGRWAYHRPHWLTPKWMPGSDSKSLGDFARFFAIPLVFVGCANATLTLFKILPVELAEVILALDCAFMMTWIIFRKKSK